MRYLMFALTMALAAQWACAGGWWGSCPPWHAQTAAEAAAKAAKELQDQLTRMKEDGGEYRKLVEKASQARMQTELRQVAAEIKTNLLFDDSAREAALKALDGGANAGESTVGFICRVFSAADARFAKALALYDRAKYSEAAEAMTAQLTVRQGSYFSAAKSCLLGQCLYRAGLADLGSTDAARGLAARKQLWQAVEAWRTVMDDMGDRVSFAAESSRQCAEAYEKLDRGIYAMKTYTACLKDYSLVLDKGVLEGMIKQAQELEAIYSDPMDSASRWMGEVSIRLGDSESGPRTQARQRQIVVLLEDLIKTQEERPVPPPDPKTPPAPPIDYDKDGQPLPRGGQTAVTKRPTTPMDHSVLAQGGPGGRIPHNAGPNVADHSDIELPPRERHKLLEAAGKVMSERYRDIIQDYFLQMSLR